MGSGWPTFSENTARSKLGEMATSKEQGWFPINYFAK